MDDDRAEIVTYAARKLKLKPYALNCIEDAKAGGGNQHEVFLKYLVNENSRVSIDDVANALEFLNMEEARKMWLQISRGKRKMSELEMGDILPMGKFLVWDSRAPVRKSWVDLADELDMNMEMIDRLKQTQEAGGQYSPANELFRHLKSADIKVKQLVNALIEIDEDRNMPSCMNVLKYVARDVKRVRVCFNLCFGHFRTF